MDRQDETVSEFLTEGKSRHDSRCMERVNAESAIHLSGYLRRNLLIGAEFISARSFSCDIRAGMNPAPTLSCATKGTDSWILRQFQMPVPPKRPGKFTRQRSRLTRA